MDIHYLERLSINKLEQLTLRKQIDHSNVRKSVRNILDLVLEKGDDAIISLTKEYDNVKLSSLFVSEEEINRAEQSISDELFHATLTAKRNIHLFHEAQLWKRSKEVETSPGVVCYSETRPIQRVGLYIPGGKAPLISTVLMLAVPAKLAGCQEIILCTPPNEKDSVHPGILFAAKICDVTRIFKVGGAQAIGAMAYGTKSIPRVSKIFGPGNQFVTTAKKLVASEHHGAAIDMPAGPTEQFVIADETARPDFVAADMLSQAEHSNDAQVVLATTSEHIAKAVIDEINKQKVSLPRLNIITKALNNSFIVIGKTISDIISFANLYAPEHLLIHTSNPESIAEKIINAGSVFLGHYTPEAAGDYASGTNHVLPTYGYAKNYSGASVSSFQKTISFQKITKEGAILLAPTVSAIARAEGLEAHSRSIEIRQN